MKKDSLNQTQEIKFIIFNAFQINRYLSESRAVPPQRVCFLIVIFLVFWISDRASLCFLTESITVWSWSILESNGLKNRFCDHSSLHADWPARDNFSRNIFIYSRVGSLQSNLSFRHQLSCDRIGKQHPLSGQFQNRWFPRNKILVLQFFHLIFLFQT